MILRLLSEAVADRRPVVLATITATDRSVPRRPGAKMLVFADGSTVGTIGGGEMEARVRTEAAAVLGAGVPRTLSYTLLDPSTGDPGVCGGEVHLFLEPYMPPTRLLVIGAGHVGQAVVELAAWLELPTLVWDDRPEQLQVVHGAQQLFGGPIDEAAAAVDIRTPVVLLTRNVAFDVQVLPVLLATPAPLVGVMGSARRWNTTVGRLREAGVTDAQLQRVRTPIGLEIGAESPKEIAVSVLAQIIAELS
jgi:xanthine dehydrogenase accessory factor